MFVRIKPVFRVCSRLPFRHRCRMLVISEVAEYTHRFRPVKGVDSKILASMQTPECGLRNTPRVGAGSAWVMGSSHGNFW